MAVTYHELLSQFEQWLRVERNLAERTRRAYIYDIERLGEFLTVLHGRTPRPDQIDVEAIREYLNHMQLDRACKSTTLARMISSIRGFFDFAVERGAVEQSPAARLRTPKQPKRLPIYLVPQEVVRLLESPEAETAQGIRDRAMMTTLVFTGMRLSELVGINLGDLDLTHQTIRVMGKGRKERIAPLNRIVIDALNRYLEARPLSDSPALFLNRYGTRLTGRSIEKMVRHYALKAGIFKDGISPHKLRHTFATMLHASEVDLIEIQALMGHASIASTQIYTHTSNSKLHAAVKKLEL
ncbi:MAG: tyrosine recombinase XerC [Candidatus Sumerlaeia bacterium]